MAESRLDSDSSVPLPREKRRLALIAAPGQPAHELSRALPRPIVVGDGWTPRAAARPRCSPATGAVEWAAQYRTVDRPILKAREVVASLPATTRERRIVALRFTRRRGPY